MDVRRKKIAIIGNGCAGVEGLKALRENGYKGEIHVFADGKWPVYNPMLTTYYVAGKIGFNSLFPYGKEGEIFNQYRAIVHSGSPVVALDAQERLVANQSGFELKFDQCLIASGASPFLPPIPGIGSDRVYVMRTVEDAVRLKDTLAKKPKLKDTLAKKPKKALVLGASMVGIKLVEIFYQAGMDVCLADLSEHIFPTAAHPECAQVIEKRLSDMGVKLRLGAGIEKVAEIPGGIRAFFENSTEGEEADLLVLCIGVRANTHFIDKSQVESKQGILVDQHMRTNVPGLYAAGDVAQGKNILSGEQQIIGLWANARYQGRTAGRNMAGVKETYPGSIPHNITHFMGIDFVGIGDVHNYNKMERRTQGRRFMQLFWTEGLLTGVNLVDDYTESGILKNAILKSLIQNKSVSSYPLSMVQNLLLKNIVAEAENA